MPIKWSNNQRIDRTASYFISIYKSAQEYAQEHTCTIEDAIVQTIFRFMEPADTDLFADHMYKQLTGQPFTDEDTTRAAARLYAIYKRNNPLPEERNSAETMDA